MAKTKRAAKPPVEEPVADLLPDTIEFADDAAPSPEIAGEGTEPAMTDPEWTAFALSKLRPDEMRDGNPTVPGLRRLVVLLLGEIVESTSQVVQAPCPDNDYAATVVARVVIETRSCIYGEEPFRLTFSGVADVTRDNTDPHFRRFPSATAETRARGRAYREALGLQRVVAAEELTTLPLAENAAEGRISASQRNFIAIKCEQCDIDVLKFISSGKVPYDSLDAVPYATAAKMLKHLSEMQRDKSLISDAIKGFRPDWAGKEEE